MIDEERHLIKTSFLDTLIGYRKFLYFTPKTYSAELLDKTETHSTELLDKTEHLTIVVFNLSVLGFSFVVFHDKVKHSEEIC